MNMKKLMAGAVASVMAVSTMAVAASAYTATMGFADGSWAAQDWKTTIEVTGDGTYTISTNFDPWQDEDTGDDIPAQASGIMVFVIDIAELGTDLGIETTDDTPYDMTKVTVSDVKVTADGTDIAVDQSKVLWGDPEGKGNLRIELFNAYGSTSVSESYDASVSPINPADISEAEKITVTFTLKGIDGDAAAEDDGEDETPADTEAPAATEAPANDDAPAATEAPATTEAAPATGAGNTAAATTDKNNADTGVEGVAVVAGLAIVAAGAVVVAKKRK